jgi:hypothetical protein
MATRNHGRDAVKRVAGEGGHTPLKLGHNKLAIVLVATSRLQHQASGVAALALQIDNQRLPAIG